MGGKIGTREDFVLFERAVVLRKRDRESGAAEASFREGMDTGDG